MPVSLSPALAAFVVITIDPVATLQALNDPIATAAAREIAPQKYVGYVSKAIDVFDSKAEYHTYAIQLTSSTTPAACEGEGISSDMYTPIFPAAAHPSGREALHPRRALPWNGCQQPSFMRSVVRVPVKLEDNSAAVLLEANDAIRFRRILAEEDEQRRVLLGASQSSSSSSLHDDASASDEVSYLELSDLDDHDYAGTRFSCPIDLVEGAFEDEEDDYTDIVRASRAPDTVVVNVSYDLSQVAELPDPLQFFAEKRQLKELVAESRARTSQCSSPIAEPEGVIAVQHDVPLGSAENMDSELDFLPSLLGHLQLPECLSTVHTLSSLSIIREVTTTIQRLRYSLAYIGSVWRRVGWRISGL
ncbi:hypothetical protein C8R45DRAFT_911740 [Mycena sanguinolenta]|nr:hypothetical protein C8R45DRAFT_911740 [Mycena sanguinolenta]